MQDQGGYKDIRTPPPDYNRGGPDTHDPPVPAALGGGANYLFNFVSLKFVSPLHDI